MSGLRIVLQRLVRRFTIRKPCWICDQCGWRERREAEVRCWKCGGKMRYTRLNEDAMLTLAAAAIAHRVCIYQEHNPNNGKVHGCCVVCGDPWPCETAKQFLPNKGATFGAGGDVR
jgi:hypothetical protein